MSHATPGGSWPWTAAALLFSLVQVLLLLYSAHRLLTVIRWLRARWRAPAAFADPERWPAVTVHLPVFNERDVVGRLVDAAAALDYPSGLLQVQVLDDSTDDTLEIARERVEHWRRASVAIELWHRDERTGFKAGALAAGLERASGEILVVLDADFVPPRDFLRRIVPRFSRPDVGMVQARWGHLNTDRSMLTCAQAVMLDAHFLLEHEARSASRLFFNFNGTAGAWRRDCIVEAGGWTHDTLTEDLDLSYRAQLAGWRFESAPDIVVPAELPSDVLALKSQQRRWARGSIQTARKLLPRIFRAPLPARVKLEAAVHLTANATYPLLLLSGLLLPWVLAIPATLPEHLAVALDVAAWVGGVLPVVAFLQAGRIAAASRVRRWPREILGALVVGAGLTWNNTLAVFGGLGGRPGAWERTPKTGQGDACRGAGSYRARRDSPVPVELVLAVVFAGVAGFAWRSGHARSLPFLLLLALGLGYVGVRSAREWAAGRRPVRAVLAGRTLGEVS